MTPKHVASYAALQQHIRQIRRSLPDAAPVFRRQTSWYGGSVRPSIARKGSARYIREYDSTWETTVSGMPMRRLMAYQAWLRTRSRTRSSACTRPPVVQASAAATQPRGTLDSHVREILQHYGAKSHYVDVTKSLTVALWFAHHEQKEHLFPLLPARRANAGRAR
jgi:FRG domain-containing protein